MRYMVFHHIRLSLNGLCTMYTFGIIVALGCPGLLWRQLDPCKMIPDLSVSRPAKSFRFLCGRLRSIRHGRKTCGRPQTCRRHTLEADFYFRPDCLDPLGGSGFASSARLGASRQGWRKVSPLSPGETFAFRPTFCQASLRFRNLT